ncbi:ATP-binding protein [Cellulosimicrobium marinum]|uniref:ATP-binding protein n=1 Tax=Cellulosimicrobium marinum TaxID=1638992 RepID=UPI001E3A2EBE|nr:ATP-binding protein [Cellulosimicrobium marinum]
MSPAEETTIAVPAEDGGLPLSRPPEHFEPVREWTLDSVAELSTLRGELGDLLRDGEAAPDVGLASTPERVVLVASELATNALEHGRPPTIVRLRRSGESWLLEVADHEVTTPPVYAGERVPGAGGLGLHLARTLALDVGWFTEGTTKCLWVTFPVD